MPTLDILDSKLKKCLSSLQELEKSNNFPSNLKHFLQCLSASLDEVGRHMALAERSGRVRLCLGQVATTLGLLTRHSPVKQTIWYLSGRLHWCLSELRRLLCGGATGLDHDTSTDGSLPGRLDEALRLLRTHAPRVPPHWQQLMDGLVAQAVTLAKVAPPLHYNEITSACQKVLEESGQLAGGESLPTNQLCLVSEALAASLATLEHRLNVAVLHIFMQVFSEPSRPVKRLVCHCKSSSGSTGLNALISEFDAHVERILLVGQFAISCCDDERRSGGIRSCLASVESVDNWLVPALRPPSPSPSPLARLLCDHWRHQLDTLHSHLDAVIDSYALTTVVFDSLTETVDQLEREWSDRSLEVATKRGWMLYKHLTNTNTADTDQCLDSSARLRLKQAINEVEAAVKLGVDRSAVLKRLRLLAAVVDQTAGHLSHCPTSASLSHCSRPKLIDGTIRDLPLDITFSSTSRSQSNYNQPQWLRKKIMDAKKVEKPAERRMSEVTAAKGDSDKTASAFSTPVNTRKSGSKDLVTPYLSRATPRSTTFYARTPRQADQSFNFDSDSDSNTAYDSLALDITDVLDNLTSLADTLSSSIAVAPANSAEIEPSWACSDGSFSVPTVVSDVDTPDRLMDIQQLDEKINQLKSKQWLVDHSIQANLESN